MDTCEIAEIKILTNTGTGRPKERVGMVGENSQGPGPSNFFEILKC